MQADTIIKKISSNSALLDMAFYFIHQSLGSEKTPDIALDMRTHRSCRMLDERLILEDMTQEAYREQCRHLGLCALLEMADRLRSDGANFAANVQAVNPEMAQTWENRYSHGDAVSWLQMLQKAVQDNSSAPAAAEKTNPDGSPAKPADQASVQTIEDGIRAAQALSAARNEARSRHAAPALMEKSAQNLTDQSSRLPLPKKDAGMRHPAPVTPQERQASHLSRFTDPEQSPLAKIFKQSPVFPTSSGLIDVGSRALPPLDDMINPMDAEPSDLIHFPNGLYWDRGQQAPHALVIRTAKSIIAWNLQFGDDMQTRIYVVNMSEPEINNGEVRWFSHNLLTPSILVLLNLEMGQAVAELSQAG